MDEAQIDNPEAVIQQLSVALERLGKENEALRHRVKLLTHRLFGRRSEKGVPVAEGQGVLPLGPVVAGVVSPEATDEEPAATNDPPPRQRKHQGRRPLPKDLPRERIEVLPPEAERYCSGCASAKVRIGQDTTEELEYVPASFVIREYVRPKLACAACQSGVTQAALPARPIEKGRPGPGLLAYVASSKYADHLPLYRLERIFLRHGIEVTRRTLAEWNGAVADLLAPIVVAMRDTQLLKSPWIQCDDTTLDVQDHDRQPAMRQGHMWVYRDEQGDVVYDFTWARNREGPLRMLKDYRGYLQADAAPAYDDVYAQYGAIQEVGCWAHARRYFKEATPTAPVACAQILAWIAELYAMERTATDRGLSADARRDLRQQHARPILERLQLRLNELMLTALPKSPLTDAMRYTLNNWVALNRYTEDGRLKIDNNGAENALRPIVLGRKNWMFAGSEGAAHRAAILCSLVYTCRNLSIDPFTYLRDVIDRVSTHPASRVLELTPREWKRLRQETAAQAAA